MLSVFRTALASAFISLQRHPLRSLLTGVGVFVGVFSVILVLSLGEGAERELLQSFDRLGKNLVTVRPRSVQSAGVGRAARSRLTESDARRLMQEVPQIADAIPLIDGGARVQWGSENAAAQLIGTELPYFKARNYGLASGTLFTERQVSSGARVCVIGPSLVEELFGEVDPVGESIRIGKHLFFIQGVLEAKGETPFGVDQDNVVIMPLKTMRAKVAPSGPGEVRQILVAGRDQVDAAWLKKALKPVLRQLHGLKPGDENDFSIRDQLFIAKARQGVVAVMKSLLLSIAVVSLFIGGIGVMNIMLVSVAERSPEIGLRLAVGARAGDVLIQFLLEALVLCLLGGALGVVVARFSLVPLEGYFGWELDVSLSSILVAFSVSTLLGILFGFLPAQRAARLDPVEALRQE
ncbi:MAG: ABC transporter permease [Polyangiaceae bacterium]|nr:ABC transporter permease [Polyangiaceae bacterium]